MPWGEGVVARGWVYGTPRGWGGDTFTISCDSLSDREERRDPALRGSRNDERARRRFANRKTATRYIGEFTYSLSRSFLAPYIYIYTPRSSLQCVWVCDYRSRRGDSFSQPLLKTEKKKGTELFIFYPIILAIIEIFFSFNLLDPWADEYFFFFVYPLFTKENFSWNIYELNIIITIIIIIHVLRETKKLSLDRFSRRLDTDPRFV